MVRALLAAIVALLLTGCAGAGSGGAFSGPYMGASGGGGSGTSGLESRPPNP